MAINFRKYVNITSGIGGRDIASTRDYIARLYTTNPKCPAGGILELDYAEDVAAFFGGDSEEYNRAIFYFSWISKTQTRPKKISFVLWPVADIAAHLRGIESLDTLEAFTTVADGSFTLTLDDTGYEVTGCSFTAAVSYADIASVLQTKIRAKSTSPIIAQATVVYDAPAGAFIVTVGEARNTLIKPLTTASTGTYIGALLGLDESRKVIASQGVTTQTVTETLNASIDISNNFGSFTFIGSALTMPQIIEAAKIAHNSNMQFMLCLGVTAVKAAGYYEALKGYSGVALTLLPGNAPEEYHEMMPMILLAATDYRAVNGTLNYMFHQFPTLNPTVTTTPVSNQYDALHVNYYGRTQQAGQKIDFYQRGVLCGEVQDMNIFANEMWMKDQCAVSLFNLLMALPKISANKKGRAQLLGCLQSVIAMGLHNGTISVGKTLNYTQRTYIKELTNDDKAWSQIENVGWWLNVWFEQQTINNLIEWVARYRLVYAKDDIIRKVDGQHTLI